MMAILGIQTNARAAGFIDAESSLFVGPPFCQNFLKNRVQSSISKVGKKMERCKLYQDLSDFEDI